MTRTFVSAALAAAALLAAAPAAAEPQAGKSYLLFVPVGDLELASKAGERKLERRMRVAARQICGVPTAPGFHDWKLVRDCRTSVLGAGRDRVEQAMTEQRGRQRIALASR